MESEGAWPADILLVEDNPGDVRLVEEALDDGRISNRLHTVVDGQEALNFIYREGEYADAPRPDIVLLDYFLPKRDSEEVLHEIKHHPRLADVPVIILTGGDDDYIESQDLDHDADEDAVLEKPLDVDEFLETLRGLDRFQIAIGRTDD